MFLFDPSLSNDTANSPSSGGLFVEIESFLFLFQSTVHNSRRHPLDELLDIYLESIGLTYFPLRLWLVGIEYWYVCSKYGLKIRYINTEINQLIFSSWSSLWGCPLANTTLTRPRDTIPPTWRPTRKAAASSSSMTASTKSWRPHLGVEVCVCGNVLLPAYITCCEFGFKSFVSLFSSVQWYY